MQVKIARISKKDTDKDGIKLEKNGKPYWRIGIQLEGHGEDWYSGFANGTNDPRYMMEVGGTYSLALEDRKVGDRTYKNFRMLSDEEKELEELRAFKASQANASTPAKPFEPSSEREASTSVEDDIDLGKF